ncbi:hypothetical protein RB597_007342 [Gaeumannomyces tritici]
MRSHLARHVCRASPCLAGLHVRHISISALAVRERAQRLRTCPTPLRISRPPSRTFFGGFKKPARDVKDHRVLPGYDQLLMYSASETDNIRPPAAQKLVAALRSFFQVAKFRSDPINSTQAFCALRTLVYLTEKLDNEGRDGYKFKLGLSLEVRDFHRIQEVARRKPAKGDSKSHLELARLAYKCQCLLDSQAANNIGGTVYRRYVSALARQGAATEASELLSASTADGMAIQRETQKLWMEILEGLAEQDDETTLVQKATELNLQGFHEGRRQKIMTSFYAKRGDASAVFEWYYKAKCEPFAPTLLELLRFARRHPEATVRVNDIFTKLCGNPQIPPPRHTWDVILQWAVSILGKDIDGIDQTVNLLPTTANYPDTDTLNKLLETAIEMQNPALAERFWLWSVRRGIPQDIRSRALQLEYRLEANDFVGAHSAMEALVAFPREHDHGQEDADEEPRRQGGASFFDAHSTLILNKYIQALCVDLSQGQKLLSVLGQVEEFEVTLEPETTADLCIHFLRTDQLYELMDTLSLHALQYSLEERAVVRDALVKYSLDEANSTARVWDSYTLLREYFPDTNRASRVQLMDAFFGKRKRPDMAVLVFGHMRAQENPAIRPDAAVYTRALEQLGRHPDRESLGMVHNMLKMDATVQPDTKLYNGLMMAYTGCGDPETSLEFWREISGSPDGPTYDSLAIFFWTCEKLPFGDERAGEVWAKMMRMEVEVPPYVFGAYCGAIAGNGDVNAVKKLFKDMRSTVGYYPDHSMLRISYNALPSQDLQDNFEEWAKQEFPELWAKLDAEVPRTKDSVVERSDFRKPRDELKP